MKKIIWNTLVGLVILLMTGAVFVYLAPHFNWHVDSVVSGSMEPAISTGSLVVISPINPKDVKVGDVITFAPVSIGQTSITHRVSSVVTGLSPSFVTKGDANTKTDPFLVPARNLTGKVSFHLPYLGAFIEFLKSPVGFTTAIVVPGIVVTIAYILAITREVHAYMRTRKKPVANEY